MSKALMTTDAVSVLKNRLDHFSKELGIMMSKMDAERNKLITNFGDVKTADYTEEMHQLQVKVFHDKCNAIAKSMVLNDIVPIVENTFGRFDIKDMLGNTTA